MARVVTSANSEKVENQRLREDSNKGLKIGL